MSNSPQPLLNRFRRGVNILDLIGLLKRFALTCQGQLPLTGGSVDVFQYKRDRRQVDRKCSNYDENHERQYPSRAPLSTLDMFEMGLVDLRKLAQTFAQPLNGRSKLSGLLVSFHAASKSRSRRGRLLTSSRCPHNGLAVRGWDA